MVSNVRMRFGRALSCTSACSRAIRHRIIRGQVRCGSQQLGKLEGVVFYFRDIQRVPVPRVSLLFALRVVDSFLRLLPFLLLSRARSSMQPSQKLDDKWAVRDSPLADSFLPLLSACFRLWAGCDNFMCITYCQGNLLNLILISMYNLLKCLILASCS